MKSLDAFAQTKLRALEENNLRRHLVKTVRPHAGAAIQSGKSLISFACNDYLGLSLHPEVQAAAARAAELHGAGGGASRLITGNHPLSEQLEAKIAEWKKAARAIVFGSGYLANLGIVPALVGEKDIILADELCHACLHAGSRLSRAKVLTFRHNDVDDLANLLRDHRQNQQRCLVITDGVFSMDGDIAPLPEITTLCETYDAWLLVDDAHGLGVLGEGRGSPHAFEDRVSVPLQMGTFSKAVGSYGGYLCASEAVISLLHSRARSFVYSTALPPSVLAASLASLDIIQREPERCALPMHHAEIFCRELGLPAPKSQIVPILLGSPEIALEASAKMATEGFLVTAIRPPTVPPGTSRLRFAFCATHQPEDVVRAARCISPWMEK